MKIVTIVGARPQFIKMAPMSQAIKDDGFFDEITIHTGQHFDFNMSQLFFDEMRISPPNYQLKTGGLLQGQMTGRQIEGIEEHLLKIKPEIVLLYGDTNSTLAGAISATKLNIPVAHIEAGLRSFNKSMPEEINRIIVDHISTFLFAPTDIGVHNLINEGIDKKLIHNVGDIMFDAVIRFLEYAKKPNWFDSYIDKNEEYILCTVHRNLNTENPIFLSNIFSALGKSSKKILLPIHPRTKLCLEKFKINPNKNILIVDPVGYFEMLWLIKNSSKVVTDSGGLQKEAYFLSKKCITLREETEWEELVKYSVNTLVGTNTDLISNALNCPLKFPTKSESLYGSGDTSIKILEILKRHFS